MSKFVLNYFGGNGRAVTARALLTVGKADWQNNQVKMEDWAKLKPNFEFGQMPVLEHNGKKYSQSIAINIYLAKTFKLYGKNIEEEYQIDSLFCTYEDVFPVLCKFTFNQDASKADELKKAAIEKLKFFAEKLEKRYVSLGKGKYFLGNHFTAADVYLASGFYNMCHILKEEGNFEKYAPNLCALIKRVKANELKVFFEKYYVDGAPF
jgi:glutathione S-transferase